MSFSEQIKTALEAANSAIYLNSSAQISRAAKAWMRCNVLGVDTEFVRERTFYANLGLVQISDGQTVWLLDPLVEGADEPLRNLLQAPSILKIFHSPSEDLDVLYHSVGAVPEPMIDTQLACAMLGQPLQSGYHTAVEWLLDVPIDKDQTRSNWCARPLNQRQLKYAALDVCLLPMMWEILKKRLSGLNRLGWLDEDCNKQIEKAKGNGDASHYWQRIRGIGRLDGVSLAILQSLTEWRESLAIRRNLPRGFVFKDPTLLHISRHKMTTVQELEGVADLHPRAISRHGPEMIDRIKTVIASGSRLDTIEQMSSKQRKQLAGMREAIKRSADALDLDPAVLAAKKDLEALILSGGEMWTEKLQGWRKEKIGDELIKVLEQT
jgi:ribonuclease D